MGANAPGTKDRYQDDPRDWDEHPGMVQESKKPHDCMLPLSIK